MDRKFVVCALCYALLGMLLGIHMAASQNHGQFVTHAHIMLVGFVVSFIYGLCHRLWLGNPTGRLAQIQFYLHQGGALLMAVGLFLLYGKLMPAERVEPVLSLASLLVLAAMATMLYLFGRHSASE
ncbi:hypothetical protein [Aeromonas diversa]|uniref:TonB-dependent receptor n=1 Tax=Aeromonas diversa CDC 2478-85 TaxID=1268237 RepID=N9VC01_9GAMM|nr:hypothetical protein [Aeromonas diversa]ENY72742.1 TonB-dependent receptor [Aeromonas diversa CDC 2478-85]